MNQCMQISIFRLIKKICPKAVRKNVASDYFDAAVHVSNKVAKISVGGVATVYNNYCFDRLRQTLYANVTIPSEC